MRVEDDDLKTDRRTAWEEVYVAERPRLWRSLLLATGDPEVASDAMAEAFAQGIARGSAVRQPGAWVWKAAFAVARGEMHRRGAVPSVTSEGVVEGPDAGVLDVIAALRDLSAMQRECVVLHYYAGYSLAETASILGSTRSAVGVHLFRARSRLRAQLGGTEDV